MQTYIALLRGVNVSGQKKIRMADLRQRMLEWGFEGVETYIQSGNIVFRSGESGKQKLRESIQAGIKNTYGFDVGIWLAERTDLMHILENCPYPVSDPEDKQLYFVLLNSTPSKEYVKALRPEQFKNETFTIAEECIYLLCSKGYGQARCNNNFFERKLGVEATTRNLRTVKKLIEISN